jgi:hypothetical protein
MGLNAHYSTAFTKQSVKELTRYFSGYPSFAIAFLKLWLLATAGEVGKVREGVDWPNKKNVMVQ